MTERDAEPDSTTERALAKREGGELSRLDQPWRGDEHGLRLQAAREAGLDVADVELELFTEGFKAGMTADDKADHALVMRGRTVLKENQLRKALRPTLRFLELPIDEVGLRLHDGEFELRVPAKLAERAGPALDSAKVVLKLWLGFGLLGLIATRVMGLDWLAAVLWGVGLVLGAYWLRRGLVTGRSMLAARLTVALAMLAKEEKLILPPSKPSGSAKDG